MKKEISENKSFVAKVIVKVFVMNPSADVRFGVQPQSKRIPEKLVKEESKRKSLVSLLELTQGNRAIILALREWKRGPMYCSTYWFADDERRKQRKIALVLTLENKDNFGLFENFEYNELYYFDPVRAARRNYNLTIVWYNRTDHYKWIAFPFNMVVNTYDTLYTALTSSTVIDSLKRFLSFIDIDSIVFNGPEKNFILTFYDNSVYANFYIDIDKLLRLMQSDAFGVRYQYTKREVA